MNETRDLGVMLLAATVLLFAVGYLAQCSSGSRSVPDSDARAVSATAARGTAAAKEEQDAESGKRKSIHDLATEKENEERQRIRNVAHALQTIAANPEARKTYGFPP